MDRLTKDFILKLSDSDDMDVFSERVNANLNRVLDYLFAKQDETKNESKYHHINPVFALGNFSEGKNRDSYRILQYIDNKVTRRKTEKVGGITAFNTSKIMFSIEPWIIERHYSEIENDISDTVKSFKNFDEKGMSSRVDDISLFVSLQITRSLRNRNSIRGSIGNSVDNIHSAAMKNYIGSNTDLRNIDSVKDEIALALSLKHISIHYRDLVNRSVMLVHPKTSANSILLTAPDPAVILDEKCNLLQIMNFNATVLYPISRDTLLVFLKKDHLDTPVEFSEIYEDEYIDFYNEILFNQSPKNEVFFHPNDQNYFSNFLKSLQKD